MLQIPSLKVHRALIGKTLDWWLLVAKDYKEAIGNQQSGKIVWSLGVWSQRSKADF
jgi:hypothetical protein